MGNELEAIFRLLESHAVILRQQILHRCSKTEVHNSVRNTQQCSGLKSSHVEFNVDGTNAVKDLKAKLLDLPKGKACTMLYISRENYYTY